MQPLTARAFVAPSQGAVSRAWLVAVWNIVLAAVLVVAAFGRSGGKRPVEKSPARARELRPQGDDAVLRAGASS